MPSNPSNHEFGSYGGRYVSETLFPALNELELAYAQARRDPSFEAERFRLLRDYVGRPTSLYHADQLSSSLGAEIWLKREDLCHTGAHKINNTVGQVLLARRMGKKRVIAETGAGQHGVATATACALFGLQCEVFMGAQDVVRQAPNVQRMELLGATVHPVHSGSKTLKDAMNEALRDWVTNVESTYYCVGSAAGPHPYPTIVRDLQAVIGEESRAQIRNRIGRLPDAVVACVGGGSNAIGIFAPFLGDASVKLFGVEAAGEGVHGQRHAATLTKGSVGTLHGSRSYVLQDEHGQIQEAHSISAGLDYPGVGPEHAWLKDQGRVNYVSVDDQTALHAFHQLARTEGIVPALETSHALGYLPTLVQQFKDQEPDAPPRKSHRGELARGLHVIVNLSGRGDKDLQTVLATTTSEGSASQITTQESSGEAP